jgi:hypothetical protein
MLLVTTPTSCIACFWKVLQSIWLANLHDLTHNRVLDKLMPHSAIALHPTTHPIHNACVDVIFSGIASNQSHSCIRLSSQRRVRISNSIRSPEARSPAYQSYTHLALQLDKTDVSYYSSEDFVTSIQSSQKSTPSSASMRSSTSIFKK